MPHHRPSCFVQWAPPFWAPCQLLDGLLTALHLRGILLIHVCLSHQLAGSPSAW